MDPISAIVIAAQLVTLFSKVVSISKAISDTVYLLRDPAFIAIKADLVIEQASLARWLKNVENQGGLENVLKYVEEEEKKMIAEFSQDILRLIDSAEKIFEKCNPVGKERLNRMASAMNWSTRGKADLESLLPAIHKVNEALDKLVPAPPAYFGGSQVSGPAPSSSSPARIAAGNRDNRDGLQQGESSTPQTDIGTTSVSQPLRIIQYLHHHGYSALQQLSSFDRGQRLKPETDKLGRWGELFKGPLALDLLLLEKDPKDGGLLFDDLREALVTSFIDIILIEEFVLSELIKDLSRPDLGQILLSVVSSLAVEGAREVAAQRPMVGYSFDTTEELLNRAGNELGLVVDSLYQLLPTIRIIRRGAMLNLEEQQERGNPGVTSAGAARSITKETTEIEDLLDKVLSAVSPRIPEDQTPEPRSGDELPRAPMGTKVVELLREYKTLHAAKLLGEDKEVADRMLEEFLAREQESGGSGGVEGLSEKGRLELQQRVQDLVNDLPRPAQS
ncbi:hypothetical protein QBC47DRAFT_168936 [Echria macrotheca]|uniref:Uncharacterized protein n=1 Tax=Echria macrotheca TaxID=438768 RepID=A0AAJ0BJ02_9PEZI|nr:hypothetical protein QBC47DRAFT_168936 [Echria macrotheca]